MRKLRRTFQSSRTTWLVGAMVSALVLAGCGGDDDDANAGADDGEETEETDDTEEEADDTEEEADDTEDDADGEEAEGGSDIGEGQEITIGWIPWEEDIAVTNLWQVILEDNGFEVTQTQADVAPVFDGVATGEFDLFFDAWLPATHSDYWEEYGDQVEDLGVWLPEAPLTWVVPSYLEDINSIADLQGNADMFDGQIIGIEPGSGLARISEEEVIPTYELGDDYEQVTSSTAGMLAELEAAIADEEPIVVTLWEPHPAYGQFDLKNLEDPENALGDPDEIRTLAREGFSDDFPEVAAAIENMEFDAGTLAELEHIALNEAEDELTGARQWLEDNRDYVNAWLEGTGLSLS